MINFAVTTRNPAAASEEKHKAERISQSITLILAMKLAEADGLDDAGVIRRVIKAAKVIRDETKSNAMFSYCRVLIGPAESKTVDGKRLTPTEVKLYSLRELHKDMKHYDLC